MDIQLSRPKPVYDRSKYASYMQRAYTIAPLPKGDGYESPTRESSNKCQCSTVGYSLISACIACQERDPCSWSEYVVNCTDASTLPPKQFPNPVPEGISVPHWAILDVTNENYWNAFESCAAAGGPEFGPGAILGPSGVYMPSASTSSPCASSTSAYSASVSSVSPSSVSPSSASPSSANPSSSTPSSATRPTLSHSESHAGTIGVVLGSTAIVSIAVAAVLYLRRRRTQTASSDVGASQPMPNDGTVAQLVPRPPQTMSFYDPDDPTTFPVYQAGPPSLDGRRPASRLTSRIGSESTHLSDMQASRVYRGLPMPSA